MYQWDRDQLTRHFLFPEERIQILDLTIEEIELSFQGVITQEEQLIDQWEFTISFFEKRLPISWKKKYDAKTLIGFHAY